MRRARLVVEGFDAVQHLLLGVALAIDDGDLRREGRAVVQDDQRAEPSSANAPTWPPSHQRERVQRLHVEAVEMAAPLVLGAEEHAEVVLVPAQRGGDFLVPVLRQHGPALPCVSSTASCCGIVCFRPWWVAMKAM